jgi:hypothetical protein
MTPEYFLKDQAAAIAYAAATCAASFPLADHAPHRWPMLFGEGEHLDLADMELAYELTLRVYAPLVRKSPDVPPEALYRQGRELGAHKGPAEAWQQQPAALRLAFTIFAKALVIADAAIAAEAAELARAANAEAGTDPARRAAGAGRRSALRKNKSPLAKTIVTAPGQKPAPRPGAAEKPSKPKKKGK